MRRKNNARLALRKEKRGEIRKERKKASLAMGFWQYPCFYARCANHADSWNKIHY